MEWEQPRHTNNNTFQLISSSGSLQTFRHEIMGVDTTGARGRGAGPDILHRGPYVIRPPNNATAKMEK